MTYNMEFHASSIKRCEIHYTRAACPSVSLDATTTQSSVVPVSRALTLTHFAACPQSLFLGIMILSTNRTIMRRRESNSCHQVRSLIAILMSRKKFPRGLCHDTILIRVWVDYKTACKNQPEYAVKTLLKFWPGNTWKRTWRSQQEYTLCLPKHFY
jgi:hypothetical protein